MIVFFTVNNWPHEIDSHTALPSAAVRMPWEGMAQGSDTLSFYAPLTVCCQLSVPPCRSFRRAHALYASCRESAALKTQAQHSVTIQMHT